MKTVVLKLGGKPIPFLIEFCSMIVTMMTGNPNFATPTPALADVSKAILALKEAYEAALLGGKPLKTKQRLAKASLLSLMTSLKAYVQLTSNGDEGIIASSGMGVKMPAAPTGIPQQVTGLRFANDGNAGEASLIWETVKNKNGYKVQMTATPLTEASWVDAGLCTKRSCKVEGLTSGQMYWFRVAAFNAAGMGAWSFPAQKMIS